MNFKLKKSNSILFQGFKRYFCCRHLDKDCWPLCTCIPKTYIKVFKSTTLIIYSKKLQTTSHNFIKVFKSTNFNHIHTAKIANNLHTLIYQTCV